MLASLFLQERVASKKNCAHLMGTKELKNVPAMVPTGRARAPASSRFIVLRLSMSGGASGISAPDASEALATRLTRGGVLELTERAAAFCMLAFWDANASAMSDCKCKKQSTTMHRLCMRHGMFSCTSKNAPGQELVITQTMLGLTTPRHCFVLFSMKHTPALASRAAHGGALASHENPGGMHKFVQTHV